MIKKLALILCFSVTAMAVQAQYINLPADKKAVLPTTDYVLYIPWGTLPTLYAGLHMQMHKKPGFLWFLRDGTIDPSLLPNNITLLGRPGIPADVQLVVDKVAEIIAQNPNASFTLYTDDMQSGRITLAALVANGVKEGNFFVRILSDGSGTYNFYKNLFNLNNGGFDVYNQAAGYYYRLYRRTRESRSTAPIPNTNGNWADLANQMFALASFPFAEVWLAHPDLLVSNDERMGFARMQVRARTVTPTLLFSSLSGMQINTALKLFNFDKVYYDQLLKMPIPKLDLTTPNPEGDTETVIEPDKATLAVATAIAAGKGKLMVTAPDPLPTLLGSTLSKIIADFGDDYDIFLKPHPNAMPTEKQIADYKKLGIIEVLPARMPMELLMWVYPNLKIGGFQSSLYMSVDPNQALFFISNNHEGLPEPLYSLYAQGGFPKAKFYSMPAY